MISLKTNLDPFIDWLGYTFKYYNEYDFKVFSRIMSIYNPEYMKGGRIVIDDVNIIDRDEYLKLEFTGSFFKSTDAKENIKQIEDWLTWFLKIPDLKDIFEKSTISRIDLSANDYINRFDSKFLLHMKRQSEVHRYYKDGSINSLKGITISKRGKNFVWYKCYDKREDSKDAKTKAVKRFKTFNFLRHEYEIGRKFIREKNITFKTNWNDLFFYLFDTKRVDFGYASKRNKKVFHKIVRQKEDFEPMMKQVLGICKNQFNAKQRGICVDRIRKIDN